MAHTVTRPAPRTACATPQPPAPDSRAGVRLARCPVHAHHPRGDARGGTGGHGLVACGGPDGCAVSGPSMLLHARTPEPVRAFKCKYTFCERTATSRTAIVPKCPLHKIPMKQVAR